MHQSSSSGRKMPIFFAVLALAGFAYIAILLKTTGLGSFDSQVYSQVSRFITPRTTTVMKGITASCSIPVVGVILVVLCLIGIKNRRLRFQNFMMLVNVAGAWLLNYLLKAVFQRQRPALEQLTAETGFSFPSAHAMVGVAFYGYLIYLCVRFLWKPWNKVCAVLLTLLIVAIGISRIYLGVHYASDVVAGLLCGTAWVLIFVSLVGRVNEKKSMGNHVLRSR